MRQTIAHVALVVRDYDEAIAFFTENAQVCIGGGHVSAGAGQALGRRGASGSNGTTLLLARASKPEREAFIGNQAGGRVFLFLATDDFWRDYREMVAAGVTSSGTRRVIVWHGRGIAGPFRQPVGPRAWGFCRPRTRPSWISPRRRGGFELGFAALLWWCTGRTGASRWASLRPVVRSRGLRWSGWAGFCCPRGWSR